MKIETFLDYAILLFFHYIWCFSFIFSYYMESRKKQKKLFMVSITEDRVNQKNVSTLLEKFRQKLKVMSCMTVLTSILYFLPILLLLKIVLLILMCFISMFTLYHSAKLARSKLLKIKKEEFWEESNQKIYHFDLKLNEKTSLSMLALWYFILPMAVHISNISYHIVTKSELSFYNVSSFFSLIMIILFYLLIKHMKNRTYCEEYEKNDALNRMKKYYFSKVLFMLSLLDAFIIVMIKNVMIVEIKMMILWWILFMFGIVSFMLLAVSIISKFYKYKNEILKDSKVYDCNEDNYWRYTIFGAFYSNPNDPRLIIDNNEANLTLNMAKPAVKIFYVTIFGAVALLLSYLFLYPAILDRNHMLVELSIEKKRVVVQGPFYSYEIPLESIKKVTLLNKIPRGMRIGGMGTGTIEAGKYKLNNYGSGRMYVAAKHKICIALETKNGYVIVNDDEEEKTKSVYQEIDRIKGSVNP